jgi:hypothetical protein
MNRDLRRSMSTTVNRQGGRVIASQENRAPAGPGAKQPRSTCRPVGRDLPFWPSLTSELQPGLENFSVTDHLEGL